MGADTQVELVLDAATRKADLQLKRVGSDVWITPFTSLLFLIKS